MAAYFFFFLIIWIDLSNSETFIFGTVRLFSCAFSSLCCWNMTRPLPKEGIHYILNAEKRYSPIEENSIFFLCWFSFWLSWKLVGIDQYCQLGGKKKERERDRSSSNSSSSKVANIFALIGYEETFFFFCSETNAVSKVGMDVAAFPATDAPLACAVVWSSLSFTVYLAVFIYVRNGNVALGQRNEPNAGNYRKTTSFSA